MLSLSHCYESLKIFENVVGGVDTAQLSGRYYLTAKTGFRRHLSKIWGANC